MTTSDNEYGVKDGSYKAASELQGLIKLSNAFYDAMDAMPQAVTIRAMHPEDLTESRKKLAYFLSGWLGGPRIYAENFGKITLPSAHRHLPIGQAESDAWIACMQQALVDQPYAESFKRYLIKQLRVPAEKIRVVCEK